jgi:hypothetical protein
MAGDSMSFKTQACVAFRTRLAKLGTFYVNDFNIYKANVPGITIALEDFMTVTHRQHATHRKWSSL